MVWIGQLFTDDEGKAYLERRVYVHGKDPGEKEAKLLVGDTFSTPSGKRFYYPLGENMTAILSELAAIKE